jgi:hypothetical protein
VFRDHLEETREQQRMVEECLRAHNARPSRFENTGMRIGGANLEPSSGHSRIPPRSSPASRSRSSTSRSQPTNCFAASPSAQATPIRSPSRSRSRARSVPRRSASPAPGTRRSTPPSSGSRTRRVPRGSGTPDQGVPQHAVRSFQGRAAGCREVHHGCDQCIRGHIHRPIGLRVLAAAPHSGFVCAQLVDSFPVRLTHVDDARRSDQHGAFVGVEVLVPGWFALEHDELRFG